MNEAENMEELVEIEDGVLEEYVVSVSAIAGDVCHNTIRIKGSQEDNL